MSNTKDLSKQIEVSQKGYYTDSYSMSIGEFMNMYKDKELIINPKYQREFRWTEIQKSRFIESILLAIPLPSIFIFQDKKKWEVVDGLQRLSTILQFTGVLRDKEDKQILPFKIEDVKTLPLLNALGWEDLDEELQFSFRKMKMDVRIIKDISAEKTKAKFELFQRLNQRPSILSGQEYRNALLIMYDESIFDWIEDLSHYQNFKSCIAGLEDRWFKEQYDKELILRLFVFPRYELKSKFKRVDDYLDNSVFYDTDSLLTKITSGEFNLQNEAQKFKKTFDLLFETKGEDVFKGNFGRGGQQFLESYFESIAIGLYHNIDQYTNNDIDTINSKIDQLESQTDFRNAKGSGTNTETRIRRLVPFSKVYFEK